MVTKIIDSHKPGARVPGERHDFGNLLSLLSNSGPSLGDHLANAIVARYSSKTKHNELLDNVYMFSS